MSTVDRQAAVAMIRSALSSLSSLAALPSPTDEPAADRPPAPTLAHGRAVNRPTCRPTRAAVHDYLGGRLRPTRRRRMEAHMDRCAECTRAFIDVRETSLTSSMSRRPSQDRVTGGQRGERRRGTVRRRIARAS